MSTSKFWLINLNLFICFIGSFWILIIYLCPTSLPSIHLSPLFQEQVTANLCDQNVSSTEAAKLPYCFTHLFCVERVWCVKLEPDIVPVLSPAMSPWPGIPHLLHLLFHQVWKGKPICAPNKKYFFLSSQNLTVHSLLWKNRQWHDSGYSSLPSNGTFWVPAYTDASGGFFQWNIIKACQSSMLCVTHPHVLFSVVF